MYIEMRGANGEARECHSFYSLTHTASSCVPESLLLPQETVKPQLSVSLLTFQAQVAQLFWSITGVRACTAWCGRSRNRMARRSKCCRTHPSIHSPSGKQASKHMFQPLTRMEISVSCIYVCLEMQRREHSTDFSSLLPHTALRPGLRGSVSCQPRQNWPEESFSSVGSGKGTWGESRPFSLV